MIASVISLASSPISRDEVLGQLDRILRSPNFRNSQRYSAFLKFCVERTLEGQGDTLKERTLGVEVFGRPATYDTAADHIVRSAASEIRKRLAQYYLEAGTASEIRIYLVSGSYVPQISLPNAPAEVSAPVAIPAPPQTVLRRWTIPGLLAICFALTLALAGPPLFQHLRPRTTLELFWQPVLSPSVPVLLCVGDRTNLSTASPEQVPPETVADLHLQPANRIHFAAASVLANLTGYLARSGGRYRVVSRTDTKFNDLQNGPAVLIGGFNNDWTLRLTDTLRFGFEAGPENQLRIRDRKAATPSPWTVDFGQPWRKLGRDYAIVSRVQDPRTERATVVVAGIGYWGTLAAGDFITSEEHLRKILPSAPANWQNMNVQIVLSTDVIDGVSGPPKVLVTHFW